MAYISGDIVDVDVLFTPYGQTQIRKQILNRPCHYIIDQNNPLLYHFKCTEFQAYVYFTKFGKDSIVLAPQTFQTKIKAFYNDANNAYI